MLAARVAGQADLLDVRTRSFAASLSSPPTAGNRLRYELHTDLKHLRVEATLLAEASYSLVAFQSPEDDDEVGEQFAQIEFELLAIYDIPVSAGGDYSEEEFGAFTNTTAQFALYPFAREAVHDFTNRLGVPPLTLGMMRLPLDPEEVAHPEH